MPPLKSKLWQYFNKINKETVSCKTCAKVLKTSGNTTNMKKHLKKHKIMIDGNTIQLLSESESTSYCDFVKCKMPPLKSKLWQYFNKINKETVSCKTCAKVLKTSGNTTNMKKHLKKHKIMIDGNTIQQLSESESTSYSVADDDSQSQSQTSTMKKNTPPKTLILTSSTSSDLTTTPTTQTSFTSRQNAITPSTSTLTLTPLKEQPSIPKAFRNISSFARGGTQHANITNAITYFICADNRPFSAIEGRGFRYLMKQVAPLYIVPSRELIKRRIDDKFDFLSSIYKEKFKNIHNVSITCDVWTEMMTTQSYLGVTVHYINNDVNKLQSMNIGTYELNERHTADYIAEKLNSILNEWNIKKDAVVSIITDNGANMVCAVNQNFGRNKHIPCFAHTLNLVAENSMKQENFDNSVIDKVRAVVKWIKSSVIASDELRQVQLDSDVPEGKLKKMILDVKTRWNSTYHMLQRFVELSSLVSKILLTKPRAPAMPTAVDIQIIQELITILRPLEYMTREASGEQYITVSKIIPMVSCIMNQYEQIHPETEISRTLKTAVLLELHKRFGKIEHVTTIAISTLLDPRFKNLHFTDPQAAARALSTLRKYLQENQAQSHSDSTSSESENSDTNVEYDFWNHHKTLAHKPKRACTRAITSEREPIRDELSLYLANPVSSLKSDPLETWKEMKDIFPGLYFEAQKHFCVVATSVPSERLFSKAGAAITQQRNRLSGKRLTKLIFLNSVPENEFFA